MDIGGGGVGGEGGGFNPPPGKAFGSCACACLRIQDQPRRIGGGGRKAVGWMHLTDENEAGARNLLFG